MKSELGGTERNNDLGLDIVRVLHIAGWFAKAVLLSKWRVAWQFIGFCANAQSAVRTYKFGEVDSLLSCNDCRF